MEPENRGSEKGSAVEYERKLCPPPPFLLKTCMLVEDPSTDKIISWNEDGTGFVVWKLAEFSRDLLPTVFKHSNFSSFVRQLNTYGFRKVATDRWEFKNDMFRRGQGDQLCEIRRRKAWSSNKLMTNPNSTTTQQQPQQLEQQHRKNNGDHNEDQRASLASPSPQLSLLLDENKRLKKENGSLCSELTDMKNKCKELYDLMATYNNNGSKSNDTDMEEVDDVVGDGCNRSIGPKLFGVRLPVKGENDRDDMLDDEIES